jgi:hypothetical protein
VARKESGRTSLDLCQKKPSDLMIAGNALCNTIEGSTAFPMPIPGSRSAGERSPLCCNPSDRFWLGLAIRSVKGTDSRARVPAKIFQPGASSIR